MYFLKRCVPFVFFATMMLVASCSPKTCGDSSICQCHKKHNRAKDKRAAVKAAEEAQAFNEGKKVKSSWWVSDKRSRPVKKERRKKREKF